MKDPSGSRVGILDLIFVWGEDSVNIFMMVCLIKKIVVLFWGKWMKYEISSNDICHMFYDKDHWCFFASFWCFFS